MAARPVIRRFDQLDDAAALGLAAADLETAAGAQAKADAAKAAAEAASIPLTQKGAANGVATLDANGLLTAAQNGGSIADPMRYDATRLRAFKAALADVANNPVDIATIGDSIAEGQGISGTNPNAGTRWLDLLRDKLRARYVSGAAGGYGFIPSYYALTGGFTQPVTTTGTVTNGTTFGLGRRNFSMAAAATATLTFTGTGVDIIYAKGTSAGSFKWNIDGGADTTVNANSGTVAGGQVVQVRGLASGSHTVVVTAVGQTFLEGFMVYNGDESKGVRTWDGGHSGNRTTDYLDETNKWWYGAYTPVQPSLLIWELTGVNDYGTGTIGNRKTPSEMAANIQTELADIRAKCTKPPSVLMWLNLQRVATGATLDAWVNYLAAIEELARADGQIALVDVNTLMSDYSANTYGLWNADQIHPNSKGHAAIAELIYEVLTTP